MRVLITGGGGMLAQALAPALRNQDHEVLSLRRAELDITDSAAVAKTIRGYSPDVVVQCAAYTAVDAAESDHEDAFRVNAEATGHVARECQRVGGLFVYPSTDYVFPGVAMHPYRPDDPTGPINAYGRSKLAGEQAALEAGTALIVRTSWLYGAGGGNFVDTISRLARERDHIEVVSDQRGRPTWTISLASALTRLIEMRAAGIFHVTDVGEPVTWFELAREILRIQGLDRAIVPISTAAFGRPARRPPFSVLDCSKTEGVLQYALRHWRDSLSAYLRQQVEQA